MLIALLTICLLLPCLAQQPPQCVVEGKVTDAMTGEPLRNARVHLFSRVAGASQQYSTVSDAEGRFAMDDVEPGIYQLLGERQGYLGGGEYTQAPSISRVEFRLPREKSCKISGWS